MAGDLSKESISFITEHLIKPVIDPVMRELDDIKNNILVEIKEAIKEMGGGTQAFREWRAGHLSIHDRIDSRLENQGQSIGKIKAFCDSKQAKGIKAAIAAPEEKKKKIQNVLKWIILISTATTALMGLAYVAIKFVSWIERLLKI